MLSPITCMHVLLGTFTRPLTMSECLGSCSLLAVLVPAGGLGSFNSAAGSVTFFLRALILPSCWALYLILLLTDFGTGFRTVSTWFT